jgi:hypothetical protein
MPHAVQLVLPAFEVEIAAPASQPEAMDPSAPQMPAGSHHRHDDQQISIVLKRRQLCEARVVREREGGAGGINSLIDLAPFSDRPCVSIFLSANLGWCDFQF